jgi:hypothetical protein
VRPSRRRPFSFVFALTVALAPVAVARAPAPREKTSACKRQRKTRQPVCSGVPPVDNRPGTVEVVACDGCLSDRDCRARPKGRCALTGGGACQPAASYVCRYPKDVCADCPFCTNDGRGHALCRRVPPSMPPSAPGR